MLLSSPLYNNKSSRINSSFLINEETEELLDVIYGKKKMENILISSILMMMFSLFALDFLGLLINFLLYIVIYRLSEKIVTISTTRERLLLSYYPKNPKSIPVIILILISLIFSNLFVLITGKWYNIHVVVSFIIQVYPSSFDTINFIRTYIFSELIFKISHSGILLINLFFLQYFMRFHYFIEELHITQISEIILQRKKQYRKNNTVSLIFFFVLVEAIVFMEYSLFFLIIFLLFLKYLPGEFESILSIYGNSQRLLHSEIIFKERENKKLFRLCGIIFNWRIIGNQNLANFPEFLVPEEVASFYPTGLRVTLKDTLNQGLNLGLFITHLFIIIIFGFSYRRDYYNQIAGLNYLELSLLLIMLSTILYVILRISNIYRLKSQKEESLIIGTDFIGRYKDPKIWLIKGKKIEGTNVQRGEQKKVISYDRLHGIIIRWKVLTFGLTISLFVLIVIFWYVQGGLNPIQVIYLTPYIFSKGNVFFSSTSTQVRQENYVNFVLFWYFVWILIWYYFPSIVAKYKPTLYLEMEFLKTNPIVLKNFSDHLNASIEFTRNIMLSSRPRRRATTGRPGTYFLSIFVDNVEYTGAYDLIFSEFYFDEKEFRAEPFFVSKGFNIQRQIASNLRISGESGLPKLKIKLNESIKAGLSTSDEGETLLYEFDLRPNRDNLVVIKSKLMEYKLKIIVSKRKIISASN
ncbi:MAG: hypothetical protein OEY49_02170 [Candidatus Heimdallarchaeota archaeon]|nr:hypothetical protein [Candidatus Heimdallarchaeota archaeon]